MTDVNVFPCTSAHKCALARARHPHDKKESIPRIMFNDTSKSSELSGPRGQFLRIKPSRHDAAQGGLGE
jgi:hypothetical protein